MKEYHFKTKDFSIESILEQYTDLFLSITSQQKKIDIASYALIGAMSKLIFENAKKDMIHVLVRCNPKDQTISKLIDYIECRIKNPFDFEINTPSIINKKIFNAMLDALTGVLDCDSPNVALIIPYLLYVFLKNTFDKENAMQAYTKKLDEFKKFRNENAGDYSDRLRDSKNKINKFFNGKNILTFDKEKISAVYKAFLYFNYLLFQVNPSSDGLGCNITISFYLMVENSPWLNDYYKNHRNPLLFPYINWTGDEYKIYVNLKQHLAQNPELYKSHFDKFNQSDIFYKHIKFVVERELKETFGLDYFSYIYKNNVHEDLKEQQNSLYKKYKKSLTDSEQSLINIFGDNVLNDEKALDDLNGTTDENSSIHDQNADSIENSYVNNNNNLDNDNDFGEDDEDYQNCDYANSSEAAQISRNHAWRIAKKLNSIYLQEILKEYPADVSLKRKVHEYYRGNNFCEEILQEIYTYLENVYPNCQFSIKRYDRVQFVAIARQADESKKKVYWRNKNTIRFIQNSFSPGFFKYNNKLYKVIKRIINDLDKYSVENMNKELIELFKKTTNSANNAER